MFYLCIVAVFIPAVTFARGMENSSCPESKKQYPGDCRLFYKCVPLSESTLAYVWVPSRCSAGFVFHPMLKECVSSKMTSHCQDGADEDPVQLPYYKSIQELQDDYSVNEALEIEDVDATTEIPEYVDSVNMYSSADSALNAIDQDHVPLSAVDNIPMDKIDNQMSLLKKIVGSYKTHSNSYVEIKPLEYGATAHNPISSQTSVISYTSSNSPELKPNSLPTQLNKITAQLVVQAPIPKKQPTKLNLDDFHVFKQDASVPYDPNTYNYTNPQDVVMFLFHKYLSNNSFMRNGEYVRKTTVALPYTTGKPAATTKKSYNIINQDSEEDHQNDRISFFAYSNTTNGFYGRSCLNGLRLPNPYDCTRYFLCNSSTISLHSYTCPPYTAFNKLKRMCDAAEYQTCTNQYINQNPLIEKEPTYSEVHCDTYMCGGLHNFNKTKLARPDFKCRKNLSFCIKKQKCLPRDLC